VILVGGRRGCLSSGNGSRRSSVGPRNGVWTPCSVSPSERRPGSVLSGEVKTSSSSMYPVEPGVETQAGVHEADRTEHDAPHPEERDLTTAVDNQTSVEVHVLRRARDGGGQRQPGRFYLTACARPRWRPEDRGDVRYRCERILNVSAKDLAMEDREAHDHGAATDGTGQD